MAGIRNESRRGFTLVELLTVVAIIGLLIAVLVPVVRYAQIRARNAAVASQLSGMATGLELFKSDFGYYPSSLPQTEDGVNAAEDRTGIDATTHKVQGFHRVAFALVGRDRLGCPAKRGTGTGLASTSDKGPDSISGWYYSENKGSFSSNLYPPGNDWTSTNRTARKGPYLSSQGIRITNDDSVTTDGYVPVICDAFDKAGQDNITGTGDYAKRSFVLYFAANPNGERIGVSHATAPWTGAPAWSEQCYYAQDNIAALSTSGTLTPDDYKEFWEFINDEKARVVSDRRPFNKDTYLLISAGSDGEFLTGDDIKNWME